MQIGEKIFRFSSDYKKVRRDIKYFQMWETGEATAELARIWLCRNNGYADDALTDEEFIFIAHSLGYWHRIEEADAVKDFKLHEQRRQKGIE